MGIKNPTPVTPPVLSVVSNAGPTVPAATIITTVNVHSP